MTELAAAASSYAFSGLPVFPIRPGGKEPLTPNGFKDASVDVMVVAAWWTRWPDANIGMPTGKASGLWVVDVDGDKGLIALATMLRFNGGDMDDVLRTYTPRGGRHYFFKYNGRKITNSVCRLGEKLDVRGDGGYVLLPPSLGSNQAHYLWEE